MTLKTIVMAGVVAALAMGCAQDQTPDKPAADPDATLAVGKADAVSNFWTTLEGTLAPGDYVKAEIDWPDWFHGYTLELTAGQTVGFTVSATETGYVRLYGPASKWVDGQPRFKQALVKTDTSWSDGASRTTFQHEVAESGTYLVLYGPKYYWYAQYTIETECVAGCQPEDACGSDDVCAAGQYCGHNGVVCITTPCDVAYDICKPREGEGAWCDRDRVCADGLVCAPEGVCAPPKDACETDEDCVDGFCGCFDWSCQAKVCKPWQAEGETCGGFTPQHMVKLCSPEYDCVAPWFIADIPGGCGVELKLEDLVQNAKDYAGRYVVVTGWIHDGFAMCTLMACYPDNPCCNTCGSAQLLTASAGEDGLADAIGLTEEGEPYRCGGNECDWADNCTVDDGRYWLAGWFSVDGETGAMSLEVTRRFGAPE